MSLQYAAAFPSAEAGKQAAENLARKGFAVDVQADSVVVAWTNALDSPEAESVFVVVAADFGGDYLGKGGFASWPAQGVREESDD